MIDDAACYCDVKGSVVNFGHVPCGSVVVCVRSDKQTDKHTHTDRLITILHTNTGDVMMLAAACRCDVTGSTGLQCDALSGQCPCRANILGRRCDTCQENKYNIAAGCLGLYTLHRTAHTVPKSA